MSQQLTVLGFIKAISIRTITTNIKTTGNLQCLSYKVIMPLKHKDKYEIAQKTFISKKCQVLHCSASCLPPIKAGRIGASRGRDSTQQPEVKGTTCISELKIKLKFNQIRLTLWYFLVITTSSRDSRVTKDKGSPKKIFLSWWIISLHLQG